jgi:hypothetical protein
MGSIGLQGREGSPRPTGATACKKSYKLIRPTSQRFSRATRFVTGWSELTLWRIHASLAQPDRPAIGCGAATGQPEMNRAVETAAAAAIESGRARRLANLRPFKPGKSGRGTKSKRCLALQASIVGDLGFHDLGELSGIDRIAVEQIVQLLVRSEKAKDHDEAARCSRQAQVWLRDLQRRCQPAPKPGLAEYLAARRERDDDEQADDVSVDAVSTPTEPVP